MGDASLFKLLARKGWQGRVKRMAGAAPRSVEQTGSINAAAARQGVPFRVAWRKLQEEVAQRFRMTPVGFLRGTQCNVYTHPERLRGYRRSRSDNRYGLQHDG